MKKFLFVLIGSIALISSIAFSNSSKENNGKNETNGNIGNNYELFVKSSDRSNRTSK